MTETKPDTKHFSNEYHLINAALFVLYIVVICPKSQFYRSP